MAQQTTPQILDSQYYHPLHEPRPGAFEDFRAAQFALNNASVAELRRMSTSFEKLRGMRDPVLGLTLEDESEALRKFINSTASSLRQSVDWVHAVNKNSKNPRDMSRMQRALHGSRAVIRLAFRPLWCSRNSDRNPWRVALIVPCCCEQHRREGLLLVIGNVAAMLDEMDRATATHTRSRSIIANLKKRCGSYLTRLNRRAHPFYNTIVIGIGLERFGLKPVDECFTEWKGESTGLGTRQLLHVLAGFDRESLLLTIGLPDPDDTDDILADRTDARADVQPLVFAILTANTPMDWFDAAVELPAGTELDDVPLRDATAIGNIIPTGDGIPISVPVEAMAESITYDEASNAITESWTALAGLGEAAFSLNATVSGFDAEGEERGRKRPRDEECAPEQFSDSGPHPERAHPAFPRAEAPIFVTEVDGQQWKRRRIESNITLAELNSSIVNFERDLVPSSPSDTVSRSDSLSDTDTSFEQSWDDLLGSRSPLRTLGDDDASD